MQGLKIPNTHWSFWLIVAVTLMFNVMGVTNFIMQITADSLASFPEIYQRIIVSRPLWATISFAVAVFGGSIGCLLLFLKKSLAFYVLITALFGVIFSILHVFEVVGFDSFEVWIGLSIQLLITVFLIWYTKYSEKKHWIL